MNKTNYLERDHEAKRLFHSIIRKNEKARDALGLSNLTIVVYSEAVCRIILNPLQRIRTILQCGRAPGIFSLAQKSKESILRLSRGWYFRGVELNILYGVIGTSTSKLLQGYLIAGLNTSKPELKARDLFGILTFSSLAINIITYPIFAIRNILYATKDNFIQLNARDVLVKLTRTEGIATLYKGFSISLSAAIVYNIFIAAGLSQQFFIIQDSYKIALALLFASSASFPLDTLMKSYQCDTLVLNEKKCYKNLGQLLRDRKIKLYRGYSLYLLDLGIKLIIIEYLAQILYKKSYYLSY